MNILQKLESKLTPKSTDEAVDKELEDYSIQDIRLRLKKDRRNRKIAFLLNSGIITLSLLSLLFFTAVISSLVISITCIICLSTLRDIDNKIEALESGLKRKIENNKGDPKC
ncbi:hypothetical protein [Salinicola sp. MIT1003]|uniref:hypothetical protein n=1 Tax=Salinicola sp. MIT1003 TaxID=1882734 RepID=UPI001114F1A7|nr:hypothetical protein [Salinicola sp. MIT1003]